MVSAAVLSISLDKLHSLYSAIYTNQLNFDESQENVYTESYSCSYSKSVLKLETIILKCFSSVTGEFDFYKQAISEIFPLVFILDHVHYFRWLSVHLI